MSAYIFPVVRTIWATNPETGEREKFYELGRRPLRGKQGKKAIQDSLDAKKAGGAKKG